MTEAKPKERDPFLRLKYIGYCQSQMPPDDAAEFKDFVRHAKWKLCEARGYLMSDPIWDRYREEQILVEYYAMQFERDKEYRAAFEANLKGEAESQESTIDWMEEEKAKNKAEIEKLMAEREKQNQKEPEESEDEFEFTPPEGKNE